MSITIATIDLSTAGTQFQVQVPSNLQLSQVSWIRFLNESAYTLTVQIGGINVPVPAWNDYPIQISQNGRLISGASLPINVMSQLLSIQNSDLSTSLIVTFYSPGESPASTSSISLVRQTFIPNTVQVSSGAVASQVINDTSVAGVQVVEAQVSGDGAGSAVIITNDGNLTLGNAVRSGSIDMPGGGATVSSLSASNGVTITGGSYHFLSGTITRVSFFTQAITTVLTAYNHNLGATPTGLSMQLLGTSTATATVKYDDTSMTSTQVKMIASTNCTVFCIAFKS